MLGSAVSGLKVVRCDHNMLEGELPSLDRLSSLEIFFAGFNNLSGKVPEPADPKNSLLTELSLPSNLLMGRIPDSLGQCKRSISYSPGSW